MNLVPPIFWGAGGGLSIRITEVAVKFDRNGAEVVGSLIM
jgi:hypothetical protein